MWSSTKWKEKENLKHFWNNMYEANIESEDGKNAENGFFIYKSDRGIKSCFDEISSLGQDLWYKAI